MSPHLKIFIELHRIMNFSMSLVALSILCYDPTINKSNLTATCVFLGYAKDHHGYVCFNPHDNKIYLNRHIHIDETRFLYKEKQLSDSSILGTPPEQFNSTLWLNLIASIPPPNSIIPSSSTLSPNSIDPSNNNNSGSSLSSLSASQDPISSPAQQHLPVLPTPIERSQPPGHSHPMVLRPNPNKKSSAFMSVLDGKVQSSRLLFRNQHAKQKHSKFHHGERPSALK